MARNNFAHALGEVLKHEGGYVDHPHDPGGATNMGVTHKTLADWRGVSPWWSLPKSAVKALERDEAAQIYRSRYWQRCQAETLPAGLDLALFDFAVNSGPDRAVRTLQTIVGVTVDGVIGPVTLAAISKRPAPQIINELCARRLAFLKRLATFPTFGKGWTRRVEAVRTAALSMAHAIPAQPGTQPGSAPPERGRAPTIIITAIVLAALAAAFFLIFIVRF